jgi:hypothetical protein
VIGQEYLIVGVLRRVAELIDGGLLSPQDALTTAANELEEGIQLRDDGKTKALTYLQMSNGQLIGDIKTK